MAENANASQEPTRWAVIMSSFLVLGNVLGVGVLALPISSGLGGLVPSLVGICGMWLIMLFAAWIIVFRIDPSKKTFDLPSFYQRELGSVVAKWLAIVCNLIILYGVIVAYLSGISTMFEKIFPILGQYPNLTTIVYFLLAVSLVVFGLGILERGMSFLIAGVWISFFIMIGTALSGFHSDYLTFSDWSYVPICLPIAVSAFHFHNIIPTVSRSLHHHRIATCKAIFLGVFLGLIINLIWVVVVLGVLPETGPGVLNIHYANAHGEAANVPISQLLHNPWFTYSGLIFSLIAITCSFAANGAGLYGFIRDLIYTMTKKDSKILTSLIAFVPPLAVALIYPEIFIKALGVVGGVGEDILFVILPGFVLVKLAQFFTKNKAWIQIFRVVGSIMIVVGLFILVFVIGQDLGIWQLAPST